jgi:hypothetical protein
LYGLEKLDDFISGGLIVIGTSGGETMQGEKTNIVDSGENWKGLSGRRDEDRVLEQIAILERTDLVRLLTIETLGTMILQ